MSINWYFYKDGQQKGPMSRAELESLAAAGLIGPDDQVISDQMQVWVRAADLEGLFAGSDNRQNALGGQFSPPPPPGAATATVPVTPAGVQSPPPPGPFAPLSEAPVRSPGFPPPGPAQGTPAGANSASAPPPAFVATAKTPPAFNQPAVGPVIGSKPASPAAAAKKNFKLPLIIAGVLVCLIIFVVIIASLADPGPAAAPPSSGGGQQTTPVSDPTPENDPPSGNTGQGEGIEDATIEMLTYTSPDYGFTIDYPDYWIVEAEDNIADFYGIPGTEENDIGIRVQVLLTQQAGGTYANFDEILGGLDNFYSDSNGEIFEHETGTDFIGENEYNYLMVGALYDRQGEQALEVTVVIQRDSDYYYLLYYTSPVAISEKYVDLVFDQIFDSFRFTNF
jgi:hypothetical protein